MGKKRKQEIRLNSNTSLESLLQETYNDACLQILDAQSSINTLVNSVKAETVDDSTKISKEKGGLLKIKDSAIRIKLEVAKLQSEIIKNNGNIENAVRERSGGENVSVDDFKAIREMIKKNASE